MKKINIFNSQLALIENLKLSAIYTKIGAAK